DGCDRLVPGGIHTLMAHLGQASLIHPIKAIAPFITHPPLIDLRVVAGLEAQDPRAVGEMGSVENVMDVHVASLRTAVAHRWGAREVPDPRLETKIPIGEGSHWADVH